MLIRGICRFPAQGRSENRTDQFYEAGLQQADGTWNPGNGSSGYAEQGRSWNREDRFRENVMGWIEQQATEAWAPVVEGTRAQAAFDFLTVHVKPVPDPVPSYAKIESQARWTEMARPSSSADAGQSSGAGRGHGWHTGGQPTSSNEMTPRKRQRTRKQAGKSKQEVVQ